MKYTSASKQKTAVSGRERAAQSRRGGRAIGGDAGFSPAGDSTQAASLTSLPCLSPPLSDLLLELPDLP